MPWSRIWPVRANIARRWRWRTTARGLVHQRMSRLEHAEEHVEVITAAGWRSRAQAGVEAGPAPSRSRRRNAMLAPVPNEPVGAVAGRHGPAPPPRRACGACGAAGEAAVALEQALRAGLELERHDQAGDRPGVGVVAEHGGQRLDPVGVDHDVVVGEREDLAARLPDGTVPRPVESRPGLADVAHRPDGRAPAARVAAWRARCPPPGARAPGIAPPRARRGSAPDPRGGRACRRRR